jgi:predicted HAD superfamily Cof-like phosphohydrolase
MNEQLNQVKEFILKVRQPVNYSPTIPDIHLQKFRYDLAFEELEEYRDACQKGDVVEVFDSLLDQLYILLGTAHAFGLAEALVAGFNEVHRSNMTKMDENGNPIFNEKGKVVKSHLFEEPNLYDVLEKVYSK